VINAAAQLPSPLISTVLSRLHPAVRLAGVVLGLVSCAVAGWTSLLLMAALVSGALLRTGLTPGTQLRALKPWLPVAVLVVAVHALTTTTAAPLGHPSAVGLLAGLRALLRAGCSVAWLGLLLRISSMDDLALAVGWWLRPLRRLGVATDDLGLVLAVALGTFPVILGEGRRIENVIRLRSSGPAAQAESVAGGNPFGWLKRLPDRIRITVPLLECLARRAEALTLSLRSRRPADLGPANPAASELFLLALWAAVIIWLVAGGAVDPGGSW